MKSITRQEYDKALHIVYKYKDQLCTELNEVKIDELMLPKFAGVTKDTIITDTELTVRALNCIRASTTENMSWDDRNNLKVSHLEGMSKKKLANMRNFGKSSLLEIVELCQYAGVTLVP